MKKKVTELNNKITNSNSNNKFLLLLIYTEEKNISALCFAGLNKLSYNKNTYVSIKIVGVCCKLQNAI